MSTNQLILSPISVEELEDRFQKIVKEEISRKEDSDLQKKLFSPEETRKLFHPPVSKVTLHNWAKEGRILQHRIGGRVYYKYSEVMASLSTLKRYGRAGI